MKLERLSQVPETRILAKEGKVVAQERRPVPLVFTKRPVEFSSPTEAGSTPQAEAVSDVSASPLVENKERTQPSFEEAYTEVNKRLESILAETVQLVSSQVSEEGRRVLLLAISAQVSSLSSSLRSVALRTLESFKKLDLTGAAKDKSGVDAVLRQTAKQFESRFKTEVIPFLTKEHVGDPEEFRSKLLFSYVKKGDTGSAGRIWKAYTNDLVPRPSSEKPIVEPSAAATKEVEKEVQIAPHKEEDPSPRGLVRRVEAEVSEKENGEPWLDQEKEQAFEKLSEAFKDMVEGPEGFAVFQKWFVDFFNVTIEAAGRSALTVNEIQSVVVLEFSSASANAVAGRELKRPVIVFNDISELQRFAYGLTGSESARATRGFVISPKSFGDDPILGKTGLIFSFGVGDFASHEVRHTVDPYNHKREDDVIDEAFAYFTQCFSKDEDLQTDASWKRLAANIRSSESLNQTMSTHGSETASDERLSRFIKALKNYAQGKTLVEVQRFLVQCRTVEELTLKAELAV